MPHSISIPKSFRTKVRFFFQDVSVNLKNRTALKKFIALLFKKEGKRLGGINYVFCNDKNLLDINRQFLKHDYYTDIITFNLSETELVQAEIYISLDRVRDNAQKLGVSLKSELHRVIFHGALHLCGYRDKNNWDKKKMIKKENFYLARYFH